MWQVVSGIGGLQVVAIASVGTVPNAKGEPARPRTSTSSFVARAVDPEAARWDSALGEYVLDWDDIRATNRSIVAAATTISP
jgi:hypothetical protein